MTWIAFTICALTLLAAILFSPLRVVLWYQSGVVRVRIRLWGMSVSVGSHDLFAREFDQSDTGRTKPDTGFFRTMAKLESLTKNWSTIKQTKSVAMRLARRFWQWCHLEHGRIDITIGTGNPAYTGMIHGAIWALGGMITARWAQIRVYSHADFDTTAADLTGEVTFRIRLWDPLWDIIRLLATLPWRGLLKLRKDLAYR